VSDISRVRLSDSRREFKERVQTFGTSRGSHILQSFFNGSHFREVPHTSKIYAFAYALVKSDAYRWRLRAMPMPISDAYD
jgi:hypothetical protein